MSDSHQGERAVNEWLSANAEDRTVMDLMCECGAAGCRSFFQLPVARYEKVRRQTGRLLVVPEHVDEDAFEVVRRWDGVVLVHVRQVS